MSAYRAAYGTPPAIYSGEAYDATNFVLAAIKSGATTPSAINTYLASNSWTGRHQDRQVPAEWQRQRGDDLRLPGQGRPDRPDRDHQLAGLRPSDDRAERGPDRLRSLRFGYERGGPVNLHSFVTEFWPSTVDGLVLGSIYALIALGYTMVYGVLKLINFAHSEVFMVGTMAVLGLLTLLNVQSPPPRGGLCRAAAHLLWWRP